jgi:4-amino-4-deoxy-L-arabinose transferase-like glycosyltransferase
MTFSWREHAALNPARLGLPLALVAAAILRFWGLGQGVPFSVQVDEPEVLVRAVHMMKTGNLNPHFFDYPSLYMYLQGLVAVARFLVGAMRGEWASLAQAPPEAFYLWGRAVTAVLGTATVWVVYRAGTRWGRRTALLAAVMFAAMPLHVRESHYVLTDVPSTFFVMLTLLLSLRAHERSTAWSFALAGGAAGLAAGTKYNAALAGLIPVVACVMTPAALPSRRVAAMSVAAAMAIAFLAVAPYSFLDLPTFLNQFARLSSEYRTPISTPGPVWLIYMKHLRNALEWPGSVVVVAGLALGVYRIAAGPDRLKWMVATLFPAAYFYFISNQNISYGRYLLPLLPFLSLLGAAAVLAVIDLVWRMKLPPFACRAITVALALISVAPPAYTSIAFDANAAKVWTTEQAYEWIVHEIPAGSKVTLESRQILLPAAYNPTYLPQLRLRSFEQHVADGVDYLIASSQCYGPYFDTQSGGPERFPSEYADYMRIFRHAQEVARFIPSSQHPGPELRILKIAKVTR